MALPPDLIRWLEEAERMVARPVFDPATSTEVVRVDGPEPEIGWFLPPLFERMCAAALGVVLK